MLRSSFLICILTVAMAGSAWGQDAATPQVEGCDAAACDSACDSDACDSRVGGSLFGRKNNCAKLIQPRIVQACDAVGSNSCDSQAGCDSAVGSKGGLFRNNWDADLRISRNCCVLPKYISMTVGATNSHAIGDEVDAKLKDGYSLSFANGRYINDNWRAELEWAYRRSSIESGSSRESGGAFNGYSTTLNLYRDFGNGRLRPYLGAGGGWNLQDLHGSADNLPSLRVKDWGFGYQGIIGMSYKTKRCNNLFVEYRYYGSSKTDLFTELEGFEQADDFKLQQNSVVFGVRINR
ncbi:MAG: outer membrane beta-barrel protein [Mariniblastus sp.]|nr:outer membrane beta-barrel protein [Mariniblastus sp.]